MIVPEAGMIFLMLGVFLSASGGTWFSYESSRAESLKSVFYVCVGLIAMGIAFIGIGLGPGPDGSQGPIGGIRKISTKRVENPSLGRKT